LIVLKLRIVDWLLRFARTCDNVSAATCAATSPRSLGLVSLALFRSPNNGLGTLIARCPIRVCVFYHRWVTDPHGRSVALISVLGLTFWSGLLRARGDLPDASRRQVELPGAMTACPLHRTGERWAYLLA